MAQQTINIGTVANDGTGDVLRESQRKANENFTELYNGRLESVVAGANVTIDNTDPLNPIISSSGGGGGGSQDLEDVLTVGNTATNIPIILNAPAGGDEGTFGYNSILFKNAASSKLAYFNYQIFSMTNTSLDKSFKFQVQSGGSFLEFKRSASNIAKILWDNITGHTDFQLPAKGTTTQTFAMLSELSSFDLQAILDNGGTAVDQVILLQDSGSGNSATFTPSYLQFSAGLAVATLEAIRLFLSNGTGNASIKATNVNNAVVFEHPNKAAGTETYAMLSDLTGLGTITSVNGQTGPSVDLTADMMYYAAAF